MATSGTYNFISLENVQFIEEAFERIGLVSDVITASQQRSAIRAANFLLSEFINKGLNLFTVHQEMLALTTNQATYALPIATNNILEATLRTSQRPLGGVAFSSAGGVAANAFDANSATACTQVAPDGYISYDWGAGNSYSIAMVGIQSNATLTYTLVGEYSTDNITWTNSVTIPAQVFTSGQLVWFVIQVPTAARYYRVRETGGATLNIQELYFNTTLYDTVMSPISRSEYISYPNKNQAGKPSQYYVDKQINPTVTLYPTPASGYNAMFYTRSRLIQDFGTLLQTPELPQQFFTAFMDGLVVQLARKYNRDVLEDALAAYEKSFNLAARENEERVPLRIYGDYSGGWTQET